MLRSALLRKPLIVHAALLVPEPIPLFLFAEARQKFGEPLASALACDGLDEILAALRAFALIEREKIPDERDPSIATDCIRLHRLVRHVAAMRCENNARDMIWRSLVEAVAAVYPDHVWRDPGTWPRVRRLDPLALELVAADPVPPGAEPRVSELLNHLGLYRRSSLAAYAQAKPFLQGALAIRENVLDPEHPETATSLNNLGILLQRQGDLVVAQRLFERAIAICEKVLGAQHRDTATSLNNLGFLLSEQGRIAEARPFLKRALAIREKVLGPEHPSTATSLNNLASLLKAQGDLEEARLLYNRALAIRENVLGPEHPYTAISLDYPFHQTR